VHDGVAVSSSAADPGAPAGDDVLLSAPDTERDALARITKGSRVRISTETRTEDGVPLVEALGSSGPVLQDGAITAPCTGTFGTGARPRSVLAWDDRRARTWLITVNSVDRGESGTGVQGLTYGETADLTRRLGATDAVLLDGGHSTSLAVRDGRRRVDAPASAPERPVANAVLVVRR
jgi:hypothetical protein